MLAMVEQSEPRSRKGDESQRVCPSGRYRQPQDRDAAGRSPARTRQPRLLGGMGRSSPSWTPARPIARAARRKRRLAHRWRPARTAEGLQREIDRHSQSEADRRASEMSGPRTQVTHPAREMPPHAGSRAIRADGGVGRSGRREDGADGMRWSRQRPDRRSEASGTRHARRSRPARHMRDGADEAEPVRELGAGVGETAGPGRQ